MNAIRVRKKIDSETVHLPELKPFIGKSVDIIVLEQDDARPRTTEKDWEDFFASSDTDLIDDSELHQRYREFDREHNVASDL